MEVKVDHIKKADVSFDGDILKGVWLTLPKDNFNYFNEILKNKYALKEENTPFLGDKYAIFEKENVIIWIQAKHMSFDMNVVYMDKVFKEKLEKDINEIKQESRERLIEQL